MKRLFVVLLCISSVGLVAVGSAYVASEYLEKKVSARPVIADCSHTSGQLRVVEISGNTLHPVETHAKLCDQFRIANDDRQIRLIAFGPHNNHITYDGVSEKVVGPSQSLLVLLNQAGSYSFHDHLDGQVVGYFTVSTH